MGRPFNNFDHRRPGFNNRIRRLQQNNRRNGLFEDNGPHLFKQPGPPYPGPNPRAPNKPLDPTIIHPSNQYPIYTKPGNGLRVQGNHPVQDTEEVEVVYVEPVEPSTTTTTTTKSPTVIILQQNPYPNPNPNP